MADTRIMDKGIAKTITLGSSLLMGGFSCGNVDLSVSESLEIQMFGISQTPDEAGGTDNPESQTYTLTSVDIIDAEDNQISLSNDLDSTAYTIGSRPLKIFTADMSSYKGTTLQRLVVTFSQAVTGTSDNSSSHSFTMDENILTLTSGLEIAQGKELIVAVKVLWRNTVSGSTMETPGYQIVVSSQ